MGPDTHKGCHYILTIRWKLERPPVLYHEGGLLFYLVEYHEHYHEDGKAGDAEANQSRCATYHYQEEEGEWEKHEQRNYGHDDAQNVFVAWLLLGIDFRAWFFHPEPLDNALCYGVGEIVVKRWCWCCV